MKRYGCYIDGSEVEPSGGAWFSTENPYTGEIWAPVARGGEQDVDAAARVAQRAFDSSSWARLTAPQRGALLRGPVLSVIPFEDEEDAIRIANDVSYALAAAAWTRDLRRALLLTEKLKAATVWVNNYRATSFTSPFGGVKRSGIGRESGVDAIYEYLDAKCVWMSSDLDVVNPFIRC